MWCIRSHITWLTNYHTSRNWWFGSRWRKRNASTVRVVHVAYFIEPVLGTTNLRVYLPHVRACRGDLITHMSIITFTRAKVTKCVWSWKCVHMLLHETLWLWHTICWVGNAKCGACPPANCWVRNTESEACPTADCISVRFDYSLDSPSSISYDN